MIRQGNISQLHQAVNTPGSKAYMDKPSLSSTNRPILVTGAHRSGTTWVGKMLAEAEDVGLIYEPTNPDNFRPGVLPVRFDSHHTYICAENESSYLEPFRRLMHLDFQGRKGLKSARTPKDFARVLQDWVHIRRLHITSKRVLIKDPIAIFSVEWFADRFDTQIVVTVRHPAAFSASLMRMNWHADFHVYLNQPLLMHDFLSPFEEDLRKAAKYTNDIIGQAILLWRIIYHTVDNYRTTHPDWIIVRHEDLSLDPISEFNVLYDRLGLRFTAEVQQAIQNSSSSDRVIDATENAQHVLKRNSKQTVHFWKEKLQNAQIERIKRGTADVWHRFYTEADW